MIDRKELWVVWLAFAAAFYLSCGVALAKQPDDDLSLFVSVYGRPDQIISSEYENPRPPIVTKQLIYTKARVRAVYVPDAPEGSPPPYKKWKLLRFEDILTGRVLQPAEVFKKMQRR